MQRGFILPALPLMGWAAIAAGAIIAALGIGLKIQTARLDTVKTEYAQFRAGVKVVGEQTQVRKVEIELANKQRKERADAENIRTIAALDADNKRLRDERASRSLLPERAAGPGRADRITFDRAELDAALRKYEAGIQGLLEEGDKARVNLNTGRQWVSP